MIGAVFYWRNGVELVARVQSQFRDRWSLHDQWGDTRITFSGPELASLRDALNRLDLPGVESRSGRWAPKLSG